MTVTLPSTSGLPNGWSMGFATDNDKSLTVQVNVAAGGHITWPGSGGSQTSLALANTSQGAYEFTVLQYDGNGLFRVLGVTPATAQSIGMIGAAGISHWTFPAVQLVQRYQRGQWECRIEPQQSDALYGGNAAANDDGGHGLDARES